MSLTEGINNANVKKAVQADTKKADTAKDTTVDNSPSLFNQSSSTQTSSPDINNNNEQQSNQYKQNPDLALKSYSIDYLNKNLDETKKNMMSYFDTLGILDKAYDGIKDEINIGITQKDVEEYYEREVSKNDFLSLIAENGGKLSLGDEGVKELVEAFNIDTKNSNSISYEEAYKALTGVEYNEDLIANVINSQDTYNAVAAEYSAAVGFESLMASSSPKEALEYFNSLAEDSNGAVTGEELFNNYYAKLFEDNKEKMQTDIGHNLKCTGVSIKDGYLYQEIETIDGKAIDEYDIEGNWLYSETDEDGKIHYYKTLSLDEPYNVKCDNDNGPNYSLDLTKQNRNLFNSINQNISDNNLYLENVKKEFNQEFGNGEEVFDTILEEYPKMYQEAFGKNELVEKLNAYQNDMDSYSRKISTVLSIGCFAASFIPGAQLGVLPLVAAASDNIIDGVNIGTSNLSAEEKLEQFKQLGLNTMTEIGMMAVGMGISRFANAAGNKFVFNKIAKGSQFVINHARGVEAAVEYGIDNAASIAWDVAKGITDGSLFDENGNFDWKSLGQMALQDAIFNTADLRNGISLYKSMAGNQAIEVGDGIKFQIDSKTGNARCIYEDGHEINFSNGQATLKFNNSDEVFDLKYDEYSKSWKTQNNVPVDFETNGITLKDVKYNIRHLNTPQEVGELADQTLAGRSYRIATAGYSAAPEGYEETTKAFMKQLDQKLGEDNTGYVTSPTADKGSIDAITTEVAGLDSDGRLFYTTADSYTDYINPENFPEEIDASKYVSKPKTTLADAGDYSRATAEASNAFLATGGRNATVSDFKNALDSGNDAIVLDNKNLQGDVWNSEKGRVENASRYIQEQVQAVIEGKPLPYPEVEGFTREYIENNLDKIEDSVIFCATDGSPESISLAANQAGDFLINQRQQRLSASLERAGFDENVINKIRAEGADNFYGEELYNHMVNQTLDIINYLQIESEKGTPITPELIEDSIYKFSPDASGASMAMQLSIIGNNWTNADGVQAIKKLYSSHIKTLTF